MKSKKLWENKTLGISIFPNRDDPQKMIDYMKLAQSFGIKRVFTNLIGLSKEELTNFTKICQIGKSLGMDMMIDVDQQVCHQFGVTIEDSDFFEKMGARGIRLDVKFDAQKVAQLSLQKKLVYEINASDFSGLDQEIPKYDYDGNYLVASHNFYPQPWTALSVAKFQTANQLFRHINIKTSAFVTINRQGCISAWKEAKGTPTLEIFRNMSLVDQIQFLLNRQDVDYIIVSDMYLTRQDFIDITSLKVHHLILDCDVSDHITPNETKILDYQLHKIRGDNPDHLMLRSTISRKIFKALPIAPRDYDQTYFKSGSIVILNDQAGRYKGELHILKKDLLATPDKNLVGNINNKQRHLLNIENQVITFEIRDHNLLIKRRTDE